MKAQADMTDDIQEQLPRLMEQRSEAGRSMRNTEQERQEAARIANAILDGDRDVMSDNMVEYEGDLRALLKKLAR